MPVTRIEFRRIKGRGDGWSRDNYETVLGAFRLFFYTTRTRVRSRYRPTQRESTRVRRGGRDGRRKPDSGLGHIQDYRTRYTDDDWTFTQRTEQPAGRKRRAGVGQPSIVYLKRRVYTETVGGISHESVPCLHPTDRIVRRLIVTFRRATHIGFQR